MLTLALSSDGVYIPDQRGTRPRPANNRPSRYSGRSPGYPGPWLGSHRLFRCSNRLKIMNKHNIMLRLPSVELRTGKTKSTLYDAMTNGDFPRGVKIGGRTVAWPESEVEEVIQAWIAGRTMPEVRELVKRIHEARKTPPTAAA
jgi:prophage regulatory protein